MKIAIETFAGIAMLVGMLAAVDCLPGMTKVPQHPHALGDTGITACAPEAVPALLCNAVTVDGKHECVLCGDPNRGCSTGTNLYCVKNGCDDVLCKRR